MDTADMQLTITNLALVFMATGVQVTRLVHTVTAAVGAARARALILTDQHPHHTQCPRYLWAGAVMAEDDTADIGKIKSTTKTLGITISTKFS
jgi:hypothetical protein